MQTLVEFLAHSVAAELFLQPIWLWLLLLLPLFWWQAIRLQMLDDVQSLGQQNALRVKHSLTDLHLASVHTQAQNSVKLTTKSNVGGIWWLQQSLRSVLLFLLIVALAQPVTRSSNSLQLPDMTQRDLVFVLESSASFMLTDYQQAGESVSRMQAVKSVLESFISELNGDRFGIVLYAEQAYSLLPLTSDHLAARVSLQRLQPYLAGRTDEAMSEALGLALQSNRGFSVLTDKEGAPNPTSAATDVTQRAVILISDGLSQPSRLPLEQAINYAQQQKIPVYTIGVGAQSAKADNRAYTGLLYQTLESDSLQRIATQTGGHYFQIGGERELQEVLHKIDQLEGVPVKAQPSQTLYESKMLGLLQLALATFALYVSVIGWVAWRQRHLVSGDLQMVSEDGVQR